MSEAEPSSLSAIEPETHALRRKAAVALACAAGALGLAPSVALASEAPPTVTKAANTDFNGAGVPLTSEPSGYPLGQIFLGNIMNTTLPSDSGDYLFGQIRNMCGWIEADTMSSRAITSPNGPCLSHYGTLKDRSTFGIEASFNGDNGEYVDGTPGSPMTANCDRKVYYRYLQIMPGLKNLQAMPGDSYKHYYAGKLAIGTKVHYRYTTLDGVMAMVRDNNKGWVFISKSCIDGYPQGGPKKTSDTIPGAHPQANTAMVAERVTTIPSSVFTPLVYLDEQIQERQKVPA